MSTKIIRLYDAAAQAGKAAQSLLDEGFEHVFEFKMASGKGAAAQKSRGQLVSDMARAHIPAFHAEVYADQLAKGGALVLVHAPFGTALQAESLLDAHAPAAKGLEEASSPPLFAWDEATPLSSALQLPVLTDVKLPMETLTGVPSLTRGTAFLSDAVGMPILTHGVHHAETSFGLPLLSSTAAPLSSLLGLRTLSHNPTPLSSLLGLPVLRR